MIHPNELYTQIGALLKGGAENLLLSFWPEIKEYKLLWYTSYWDGPLEGVMEVDGQKCYFINIGDCKERRCPYDEKCEESPDDTNIKCPDGFKGRACFRDFHRYWAVYPLTPREWDKASEQQRAFEMFVGTHSTYNKNDELGGGALYPGTQSLFYGYYMKVRAWDDDQNYPEDLGLCSDRIIGWVRY